MSASIFNTLTMRLTTMKQPKPGSTPSPSTLLYDWVVQSGSYDERPARLYLTARLEGTGHAQPYEGFQPDVLIDIPPSTTLQDMADFGETGAKMIQFFTMPRNNLSVALCACIIVLSLISALFYRNYVFAGVCGLAVSLAAVTATGGGANQHARTLQSYLNTNKKNKIMKVKAEFEKEEEEEGEEKD